MDNVVCRGVNFAPQRSSGELREPVLRCQVSHEEIHYHGTVIIWKPSQGVAWLCLAGRRRQGHTKLYCPLLCSVPFHSTRIFLLDRRPRVSLLHSSLSRPELNT